MWDLPGPGIEPVSPALAGRFLTTAPPGRSTNPFLRERKTPYFHGQGIYKLIVSYHAERTVSFSLAIDFYFEVYDNPCLKLLY